MTDRMTERVAAALSDHYAIERELGRGGMATVYLAEDRKHRRKVAVKVLHPELAAVVGADRFLREIEIAAKLSNPHIVPLHDSGQADGLLYYVMPLVSGETLRSRLTRERQLPVEMALKITREVASALAYAHGVGVIHRDIKPENIMLSGDEAVVTDFGIARAVTSAGDDRLTETGMSLGTPNYISPEQASGDPNVDHRSDLYSLACVTFEMLAGEPPFSGPTVQAIVAKVLTETPPELGRLRDSVSPELARVIAKALSKTPADRHASAAAFSDALTRAGQHSRDDATAGAPVFGAAAATSTRSSSRVAYALAAAAAVAAAAGWYQATRPSPVSLIEFTITLDSLQGLSRGFPPLAVSPDGESVVYSASAGVRQHLMIRRLGQRRAEVIAGTEGAHTPFFSPDGQWLGFVGERAIYKLPLSGGAPVKITEAPFVSLGADWGPDDAIVFGGVGAGLYLAPAGGGVATALTAPDGARGETAHGLPHFTPNGKHVIFTITTSEGPRAASLSLKTNKWATLKIGAASGARYLPGGVLLYALSNHLMAIPLDEGSMNVSGSPITIVDSVFSATAGTFLDFSYFATSSAGTLVVVPGGAAADNNMLVWSDRLGALTPANPVKGSHYFPHLSPDGRFVAVQEGADLWTYDMPRGTRARVTNGGGTDPVWRPDGIGFAYAAGSGTADLYYVAADANAPPTLLYGADNPVFPHSWSPDGKVIAFYEVSPRTARDIWMLTRDGNTWTAKPFLVTPSNERSPSFSPDGRWLAYVSDESGKDEVYVRAYPGPGSKYSVSPAGGREPVWSRDGRELFYRHADQVMAVSITQGQALTIGAQRVLFGARTDIYFAPSGSQSFDVGRDGRFILTQADRSAVPRALNVSVNWWADVRAKVRR